jgi:hypothetical protein
LRTVGRYLVRAGLAIWDFLVGDTPEVLVVVLIILAVTFAVRAHNSVAVVILPILSAAGLVSVVWMGVARVNKAKRSNP